MSKVKDCPNNNNKFILKDEIKKCLQVVKSFVNENDFSVFIVNLIKRITDLAKSKNSKPILKKFKERYSEILPTDFNVVTVVKQISKHKVLQPYQTEMNQLFTDYDNFIGHILLLADMAESSKISNEILGHTDMKKVLKVVEMIGKTETTFRDTCQRCFDILGSNTNGIKYHFDKLNFIQNDKSGLKTFIVVGGTLGASMGVLSIIGGIVLAPFTGGLTLISTVAGLSAIVSGSAAVIGAVSLAVVFTNIISGKENDANDVVILLVSWEKAISQILALTDLKNEITLQQSIIQDIDTLIENQVKNLNLYCSICNDITADPRVIEVSDDHVETYCNSCITQWFLTEPTADHKLTPNSNTPFNLSSLKSNTFVNMALKKLNNEIKEIVEKRNSILNKK